VSVSGGAGAFYGKQMAIQIKEGILGLLLQRATSSGQNQQNNCVWQILTAHPKKLRGQGS